MKAKRMTCAVAALLVLAWMTACGPQNEFVEPPPPQVTVATPEVSKMTLYEEFPGRTTAVAFVEVRARVRGFLQDILMQPSTIVKEGDPLFLIEQEPFEAAVLAAQGQLEAAEAARDLAENEYQRKEQAFKSGGVSALDRDASKANRDAAVAEVSIAKANLEKAQIDLDYTDIRAPMAGRVSKDLVDLGNLVGGAEASLLTTIVDDSSIHANFEATERLVLPFLENRPTIEDPDRDKDRPERQVKLLLTDGSEYAEPGVIDFVDNTVDPATGTMRMRAIFPNKNGALAAGMFVRVLIPNLDTEDGTESERIVVPSVAVQRDIGGDFVLTVTGDDVVQLVRVEAGRLLGDRRVIDKGLTGNERIIVKGLQTARDGAKVTPVTEGEEPAAPAPAAPEEAPKGEGKGGDAPKGGDKGQAKG